MALGHREAKAVGQLGEIRETMSRIFTDGNFADAVCEIDPPDVEDRCLSLPQASLGIA